MPVDSAQTLILADTSGKIELVECNDCNSAGIDDWFAETRFQTLLSAIQDNKHFDLTFARKLLSGDYGFLNLKLPIDSHGAS